jgi:hypothetical protein
MTKQEIKDWWKEYFSKIDLKKEIEDHVEEIDEDYLELESYILDAIAKNQDIPIEMFTKNSNINFTNKLIDEEKILRHLISTACHKAAQGVDPNECAKVATDEIIQGILVPRDKELEKVILVDASSFKKECVYCGEDIDDNNSNFCSFCLKAEENKNDAV